MVRLFIDRFPGPITGMIRKLVPEFLDIIDPFPFIIISEVTTGNPFFEKVSLFTAVNS